MRACPKFTYVRSPALLAAVRTLECQHCGRHGPSDAAHSNQLAHGKGKSIKASDVFVAALCRVCHQMVDQDSTLSHDERIDVWATAWRRTVRELVRRGLWPTQIPIPDIRVFA